jgi:hypothetical protein
LISSGEFNMTERFFPTACFLDGGCLTSSCLDSSPGRQPVSGHCPSQFGTLDRKVRPGIDSPTLPTRETRPHHMDGENVAGVSP